MVTVIVLAHQFETARAVTEIKSLHHAHFFEQVHGAIDGGKVAMSPALLHFGENFLVCQRMGMPAQDFQDGSARPGNFARLAAQTAF